LRHRISTIGGGNQKARAMRVHWNVVSGGPRPVLDHRRQRSERRSEKSFQALFPWFSSVEISRLRLRVLALNESVFICVHPWLKRCTGD
jgi:hypothetical protein